MQTDSKKHDTPADTNNVLAAGLSPKKRVAWNKGKQTPIIDEWGDKWCNCELPDLTTPVYRGDAWCRKCRCAWYHVQRCLLAFGITVGCLAKDGH